MATERRFVGGCLAAVGAIVIGVPLFFYLLPRLFPLEPDPGAFKPVSASAWFSRFGVTPYPKLLSAEAGYNRSDAFYNTFRARAPASLKAVRDYYMRTYPKAEVRGSTDSVELVIEKGNDKWTSIHLTRQKYGTLLEVWVAR